LIGIRGFFISSANLRVSCSILLASCKDSPLLNRIPAPIATTPATPATPVATSIVDFVALIETYKPWGIYFADNVSPDNKLLDLFNRDNRNAIITGQILKNNNSGFGAVNNVKSISGTINTTIEWGQNSIPTNYTICSITRYTGNINNKRILTAKDASPSNDWVHGHQSSKRGVVYYNNEYKTDNSLTISGNINDWVVTCATSGGEVPTNILINGAPSGIKIGGVGGLKLSINKIDNSSIINEVSDFALSYVIIWDTVLSDNALKIVSDTLLNYLKTGENILFDMSSLTIDDKVKVLNVKSNFIQQETDKIVAKIADIKTSSPSILTNVSPAPLPANVNANPNTNVDINHPEVQNILTKVANLENNLNNNGVVQSVPTTSVLNAAQDSVANSASKSAICSLVNKMPTPQLSSFSENMINVPITSKNVGDQSYLWCKCDGDAGVNANTDDCKMYEVCKRNYANNNRIDFKANKENISLIDRQIYDSCVNVFENFPRYLDANTANQNK